MYSLIAIISSRPGPGPRVRLDRGPRLYRCLFCINTIKIISFTLGINSIHFNYQIRKIVSVLRDACIKYLGVLLNAKLHFHCHIAYAYLQALRKLGRFLYTTYNFFLDSLIVVCKFLIWSKREAVQGLNCEFLKAKYKFVFTVKINYFLDNNLVRLQITILITDTRF